MATKNKKGNGGKKLLETRGVEHFVEMAKKSAEKRRKALELLEAWEKKQKSTKKK